ncbi:TetR/AcrR family transcriptional regulator C-terminal domain-containing protein [Martelella lutilitoris]|nr:TetR/AcrR family transcriptional regulator C-terminal domain-containing protein [Martelella lutilitoris]
MTAAGKDEGGRRKRRPGKRAGLDVDQIIAAAKTLPLEALSMQSLADVLKVDRKALHYHVKDRQSLFELLARHTFSERLMQTRVREAADWKDACRIYARDLADSAAGLAELVDYLWFGDLMNDLPLEPVETMFRHLNEGGFTDEDAIRLMTVLSTLCLGHARDLAQAQKEVARTRSQLLKSALGAQTDHSFPNLERIASRGVDTYSADQLAFSIALIIAGAEDRLRTAGRR